MDKKKLLLATLLASTLVGSAAYAETYTTRQTDLYNLEGDSFIESNGGSNVGGALYNSNANTSTNISDSNFTNNHTKHIGGAIRAKGDVILSGNNTFYGNRSEGTTTSGRGGAIYTDKNISINGINIFKDNYANGSNGGAISLNGANLISVIKGETQFINNSVINTAGIGGAVYSYKQNLEIGSEGSNVEFNGNSAFKGGALYSSVSGNTGVENSIFTDEIDNVVFDGNTAVQGGALFLQADVYNKYSRGKIVETTYSTLNAKVANSTFIGNKAEGNESASAGGAILKSKPTSAGSKVNLTIENSTFTGNSATAGGGAIMELDGAEGVTTINNSQFTSNVTGGEGGAIISDSELNISGTTFTSNVAQGTAMGTTLDAASEGGAAIFMYDGSKATITDSKFIENKSGTWGGAISTRGVRDTGTAGATSTLSVSNSEFTGNTAVVGGAIANSLASTTITDSTFTDNVATTNGGAIYNKGTMTLSGENTFSGNTANGVANDIYNSGTLYLNGTTNLDGGITGTGIITLGASSLTNMLDEETLGSSIIQATTINVTDGAKLAFDWGDKIDATTINGTSLFVDKAYVEASKLASGESIGLFENGTITLDGDSLKNAFAGYDKTNKYYLVQDGKDIKIATEEGAGGLAGAIDSTSDKKLDTIVYNVKADETYVKANDDNEIDKANFTIVGNNNGTTAEADVYKITMNDVIEVKSDSTLTIKDAYFKAGDSKIAIENYGKLVSDPTSYEAGVINHGEAWVTGDTFQNIDRTGENGGAVSNEATGTLTLAGATFGGNKAENGGAIYNKGDLIITKDDADNKTSFINNTSTSHGGAIYSKGSINATDVEFKNNIGNGGGAVYLDQPTGKSTLVGTFEGNYSSGTAGVIYAMLAKTNTLTVGGSFKDNGAKSAGGAIYASTTDLVVNDGTEFVHNYAENGNGGAIGLGGGKSHTIDFSVGDNVTFDQNTAGYKADKTTVYGTGKNGGALFINSYVGDVKFGDNVTFTNNKATGSGGAIYDHYSNMTFGSNAKFDNNSAENGGAITVYMYGDLSTDNSADTISFTRNSATDKGGAIYVQNYNNKNAIPTTISNAIFGGDDVGGVAQGNKAQFGGAVYDSIRADLTIDDTVSFVKNEASVAGGALFIAANASGTPKKPDTTHTGEWIDGHVDDGNVNINGTTFRGNKATGAGGAIAHMTTTLTKTYAGYGTVMIDVKPTGKLNINDGTKFIENSTEGEGGAIVSDGQLNVIGATFTGNSVTNTNWEEGSSANSGEGGGAIFLYDDSITTVIDSEFSGNTSKTAGGAISVRGIATGSDRSSVEGNKLYITGSTFEDNSATKEGGAIATTVETVIANSNFTNNTTGGKGGAIYNTSNILGIIADGTDVEFSGNKAGSDANAIHNVGTVILNATGSNKITFDDAITGDNGTIKINDLTKVNSYKVLSGTDITDKTISSATGEVIFNADVSGNSVEVAGGKLTNNAKLDGDLSVSGGEVVNTDTNSDVTGNVTVTGGKITTDASKLATGSASTIAVGGGEIEYTGGETKHDISGIDDGTGNVAGGTITVNDGVKISNKIENQTIDLAKTGTTTLDVENGGDISNSTLKGGNGVLSTKGDSAYSNVNLGNIDTTSSAVKVAIDADLNGSADVLSVGNVTGSNGIKIDSISVGGDPSSTEFTIKIADYNAKALIDMTETTTVTPVTPETTAYGSMLIAYNSETGNLEGGHSDLKNAITSTLGTKIYNMTSDESIDGALAMGGTSLSVTGNGNTISSENSGANGITVVATETLSITGATIDDFGTAIDNTAGGKVNLKDVNFTNTTTAVANEGDLKLDGNNSITGAISGTNGTVNVAGGTTTLTADGSITQNSVNNSGNVVNSGKISGNITNTTAGSTLTNASGAEVSGSIINNGTVNNSGKIAGDIANSGNVTNNEGGEIIASITNTGDSSAVNNGTITGNVTNNDSSSLTNSGTIEGNVENNDSSAVTNNGDINGNVTNAGTVNNNSTITGDVNNSGNVQNTGNLNGNITNSGTVNNDGTIGGEVNNQSGGTINTVADNIKGSVTNNGTLNLNGGTTQNSISGSGTTNINNNLAVNNSISGNVLNLNNGIMTFGAGGDISNAAMLNVNGGGISVVDGKLTNTNLGNVTLNGKSDLALDFDLNSLNSDTFTTNSITNNGGSFNVNNINIIGTTLKDNIRVSLGDTTNLGKDNVTTTNRALASIMTPIRRLNGRLEDGYLIYAPSGNGYKDYNPAALVAPVAAQLGGYFTQLNSYDEAFRNLDMKMLMTREERQAWKMANRYAGAVTPTVFSETYLPEKDAAGWFRPYAAFEKVNLNHGPKVNNTMYGSFFGGDSNMYELSNGVDFQYSVYVGYNGSHQSWGGNSVYQNGGNFGATGIWYKDNFFTALTANVGASAAEASTAFGHEDFAMLMAGVASKTGYNWELAHGKFIIQPSYLMSYTFVNLFDYTNAAGARIKGDPLNAIQIAPGLKFIGNLKHGWQPYASVRMVWNILDKTDFVAAESSLPDMSVKPYIQYGVGVQKRWGERFTGFLQAMIRNGGRNGIALAAGFRWAVGKDYRSSASTGEKKIVKEMTAKQKAAVSGQKKVLKQMASK